MGLPGYGEWLGLAVIGLLLFGPRKLPELMRGIGQGIAQFKKAVNEAKSQLDDVVNLNTNPQSNYTPPSDAAPTTDYPDYTADYSSSVDATSPEQPRDDGQRDQDRRDKEDPNDRRLRPLF